VACLRHVGPYEDVRSTWIDLTTRLTADRQIRPGSLFIGVGHDNPAVTPASELRYDACITVGEAYEPKSPMALQTIAGGHYAVAKNCPVDEIKDAFQFLYGKWLAENSRELRPAPAFLVLNDARDTVAPKKRRVDIYMPLQPKRARMEPMKIEVTNLKPQRVAYLRHVGPYETTQRVWLDLTTRLKRHGLPRKDSLLIGAPLDNPKTTPREKLRYDACVSVDAKFIPTRPIRVRTIAGGDHVVVRNCPFGAIARGYQQLFGTWLPTSGRKIRNAPSFLVSVNGGPEKLRPAFGLTDIYLPLEPSQ